eukprot:180214-Pelagomonas_calceolata.AAC.1
MRPRLLLLVAFLVLNVFVCTSGGSQGGGGGMVPLGDPAEEASDQEKVKQKPDPNESMEKLLHWAIGGCYIAFACMCAYYCASSMQIPNFSLQVGTEGK